MVSLISIYLGGILTLIIALYHSQLYKMLNWSEEFEKIENANRKILYTIHLALTILFFIIGIVTIFYASELSKSTGLAFGINLSLACFWVWRIFWQLTYQKKEKGRKTTPTDYVKIVVPLMLAVSYLLPIITTTNL